MEVAYPTFNGWIDRNQFRRTLLPKLEELLGWAVSERAAERLGVNLIDSVAAERLHRERVEDILRVIRKRYRGMQKTLRSYAALSNRLFESLAEGMFFIFTSSTVHPLEFQDIRRYPKLAVAIEKTRWALAQAVLNGCLCLYVRPSKLVTDYYRSWEYSQLTNPQEVKRGLALFENFTLHEGTRADRDGGALPDEEVRRRVRGHLLQCTIDKCPMWMPGVTLAMIGWGDREQVCTAMTLSLPGRHFGDGVLTYPTDYYPLLFRYLRFCRKLCDQAIQAHQPNRSRDGRGRSAAKTHLNVQVDREHRTSAETLAFFHALDEMLRSVPLSGTSTSL